MEKFWNDWDLKMFLFVWFGLMEYLAELFEYCFMKEVCVYVEYNGLYKKQSFFFFKENFNLFVFWIHEFENIFCKKKIE